MFKLISLTILLLGTRNGRAQEEMKLSMADAVKQAVEHNWQIQKANQNLGIATSELRSSNAVFLPNVNLSETYATTTDPLSAFGFKLQQQIASSSDFNPEILNDPGAVDNFKTRIYAEQPIINLDGINARKAASAGVQASEFNLRWTKSLISLQAKNLYFQLQLAHENSKVAESALEAAKDNYRVANDLFNQDLIHKADLLSAELRMTEIESQRMAAENQKNNANAALTHFLRLDRSITILPADLIANMEVPKEYLEMTEISSGRSDLQALSSQVRASDQMVKSSKGSLLPRLNAFASYEWNDQSLFGTSANNYMLGARLEWDIFKGGKNLAMIQRATYRRNLAEISLQEKLSDSQRELDRTKSNLILAKKQVELAALAVKQAEETYRVRADRFEEGLERTSDVLFAESDLLAKRINHLQSMNNYQQLIFNLELLLEQEVTL
ncbi:MAG: TolC family protein [Reichenbachiella sp.]|uniref:TolC family protein n=1 Tax=Reichenbachiella sp. TaxID=2184521 RepID=UPI003265DCFF